MISASIEPCSKKGRYSRRPNRHLARRNGDRGPLADVAQRGGMARVDLDPEQVERLHRPRHLQKTLGLVVEVQVDQDVHIRPGALAEGGELLADGVST